jgi:hypothetical protein
MAHRHTQPEHSMHDTTSPAQKNPNLIEQLDNWCGDSTTKQCLVAIGLSLAVNLGIKLITR